MMNSDGNTDAVRFEDGELEIALVTANRPRFVEEWLRRNLIYFIERNIFFSIYDSSDNDDTETLIVERYSSISTNIHYHRIDNSVSIGYKPILPIRASECKYIWITGDSRDHKVDDLDRKLFSLIKKGDTDYIVLHIDNNDENDGKRYYDKSIFLRECFLSMTCIGLSIYRVGLFRELFADNNLVEECMKKYDKNFAFAWIGYFLEAYARYGKNAVFLCIPIFNILPGDKIQSWYKRFYRCWCSDLCSLMDGIDNYYEHTDVVIKETWIYMNIDMPINVHKTKLMCDLTPDLFEKYYANGLWNRVTDNVDIYRDFAYAEPVNIDTIRDKWIKEEKKIFMLKCKYLIERNLQDFKHSEVCIYGAGEGGRIICRILDENQIEIKCFYDNNASKIGAIRGYDVRPPSELDANDYVIVSFMGYRSIKKKLIEYGVKREKILYIKEHFPEINRSRLDSKRQL